LRVATISKICRGFGAARLRDFVAGEGDFAPARLDFVAAAVVFMGPPCRPTIGANIHPVSATPTNQRHGFLD
jgi:hypothetical protein